MKYFYPFAAMLLLLTISCRTLKNRATPAMEIKNKTQIARTSPFLERLLHEYPDYFDSLLQHNQTWNIQIIYTKIDRDKNNAPSFHHFYYNVDPNKYFYPASTVKMPVAALALQKINQLAIQGLDKNTPMLLDSAAQNQIIFRKEANTINEGIGQYIKKIFLVSDNDAFNHLYEFLGQEYINNSLHEMGYNRAQIIHRLNISLTEEQNRITNPVRFIDSSGKTIYETSLFKSKLIYQPRKTLLGKGYDNGDSIVYKPFDFSKKNRFTLPDIHSVLQSLIFPKLVSDKQRFQLKKEDYPFLWKYMSMYPRESSSPTYDTTYFDTYVKFLFYGAEKIPVDPSIRIFNKVGDAYGFLTDAAYIVDFKKNIEFFLSATIACNSDGIFNDNHYDYETVGLPFLKHLGQVIYNYELKRKRKNLPDLSNFKIDYRN